MDAVALFAGWVMFWFGIFYYLVEGGHGRDIKNGLNNFGYWTGKIIGRTFRALRWPR